MLAPARAVASIGQVTLGLCLCSITRDLSQPGCRRAAHAVHVYTNMANCYGFDHKGADLVFPAGSVEVVSRTESSKAALSCSGFCNLLASESNIFAFLGNSLVQNSY